MNRYALLKDSINDSIFGVIVDSNGLSKFYGVSAKGLEWSKWANGINVKSENNGLPIGVVVGGYSALRNTSPNYVQALVDTVSLRNPSINKKQGISDSLIKNSSSVVPGVRDAELRAFDIDKRNEAIAFKARAFRTDSKVSSLLTQVRAERLGFVSAEGVFSSRNPIHTPEVKQAEIIDSYGRSLQRAIGLSLIRKKSVKMLAVVRKDQALAKSFGIEVKAASIGPKIGSRLSGGLRAAPAGMSFVDITGVTDADTDGIVFEGKPGLERPIIPRFMVPKDLARKLSGIVEGDAEVIEKQRRAGNTSVQFDEGKLRNIIASVGGDANMLTALTGENGIPATTPSGRERLSVSAPSPTGIARDVARDAVIGSRVRSGQRSDLGDATPLSSGELKKLSQQELVDRLIEDRNAGLNLEEAAKKYGLKGGRAEARRLEAREMSRRDSGMRSRFSRYDDSAGGQWEADAPTQASLDREDYENYIDTPTFEEHLGEWLVDNPGKNREDFINDPDGAELAWDKFFENDDPKKYYGISDAEWAAGMRSRSGGMRSLVTPEDITDDELDDFMNEVHDNQQEILDEIFGAPTGEDLDDIRGNDWGFEASGPRGSERDYIPDEDDLLSEHYDTMTDVLRENDYALAREYIAEQKNKDIRNMQAENWDDLSSDVRDRRFYDAFERIFDEKEPKLNEGWGWFDEEPKTDFRGYVIRPTDEEYRAANGKWKEAHTAYLQRKSQARKKAKEEAKKQFEDEVKKYGPGGMRSRSGGGKWDGKRPEPEDIKPGADLSGADLNGMDLRGRDLTGANLQYANLTRANLEYANLTSAKLSVANMSGANLIGANLRDADLRRLNLTHANLYGADLDSANLKYANLRGASLTDARLFGAWLEGANLTGANLSDADLRGVSLRGANLTDANLTRANLYGADMSRANLTRTQLDKGWEDQPGMRSRSDYDSSLSRNGWRKNGDKWNKGNWELEVLVDENNGANRLVARNKEIGETLEQERGADVGALKHLNVFESILRGSDDAGFDDDGGMRSRSGGMRSRSTEQKRIDSNLRAMDAAVGGYARWDDESWDNYRHVGRVLDGENLNQADRDSLSEAADKIASGELLKELKPNDRRQVVSDFRMASGMLRSRSDYDSSLSRNGWRKNGDKWNKGNWELEVLVDENNGANRLVARNKEIGETLEQERGADVGALKHLNVFESILRGSDDAGFDDDGGMRSRSGGMRSRSGGDDSDEGIQDDYVNSDRYWQDYEDWMRASPQPRTVNEWERQGMPSRSGGMRLRYDGGKWDGRRPEPEDIKPGADLSGAQLSGMDLEGRDLTGVNLYQANLLGAKLSNVNLSGANLHGARIAKTNLKYANLTGADLRDTKLYGADLRYAKLSGADLLRADLRQADLRDADLRDADLTDANLEGANLKGAILDKGWEQKVGMRSRSGMRSYTEPLFEVERLDRDLSDAQHRKLYEAAFKNPRINPKDLDDGNIPDDHLIELTGMNFYNPEVNDDLADDIEDLMVERDNKRLDAQGRSTGIAKDNARSVIKHWQDSVDDDPDKMGDLLSSYEGDLVAAMEDHYDDYLNGQLDTFENRRDGGMRSRVGMNSPRDKNVFFHHVSPGGKNMQEWSGTAEMRDVVFPKRDYTGAEDVSYSDKIILSAPSDGGAPEGKVYIAEFDEKTGRITVRWGKADSRNLQTKIYSGKTEEDFHKLLEGKEKRGYRLEGGRIPAKDSSDGNDQNWTADYEKQTKMGMRSSTATERRPHLNIPVTGSSALRQASYNEEKDELVVTYASGKTYTYENLSYDDLDEILSGPDRILSGSAVNEVKKKYNFREGGTHTFDPQYQDVQGPGGEFSVGKLSRLGRGEKTQIPVSGSSAIEALTWDDENEDLIVTYAGGRTYTYKDVDSYWIEDLERETGTGRIINNIKKEGYRVVGGGEHGDMPSEGLTAERAEFGMRSRMAPSSGRIRAAEMEISARPQGMASRRSEGLRDPRFAVPGRDRVDPSDGELWGRLSDEEKTTVADRAVNREKMLLNEFKQRFPRWWDRASKEADKKGWDKDLMNGGNAGWMDELHRFVTRLADDPDYPEKNRVEAEKQFNDLQALYNMRSNRGSHDLLEHLNPTSRRYLFDDARRDDSKKTRISASGKEMKTPSTAPRPLGDPIDTGTPIREQVGQNEKKPLKARLDAYYKRMSDKILYTDPARQARREMRKARRQGINAGGFTTSEANPVDDAKRKIRRRKRLKEMRKNRTRDIGSISDSSTGNRIDGRLAHTDSQGSLVFGEKLTSTLATMMKNYRTESKLKKTKGGVSRNRALAVLWDGAGYNGTPHVVTPEEFKALHAAGWVPVVRGHGSGANGVRYANDWIDDPVRFITGQGGEAQGEGEYWARPTQGGGGWFSWMDGSLPAGTVGLLPPSTRRVSKAELGKIKSEHAPLAKSIKAFDAGLPSGEREKMDAEEYVTQLRDHLRTSLGPVYESTMSTKMGQMTSKILESLSGSSDSKKQELLDALEFLELISTKRTSNSYAPLLGYDTIMADSGVELIHNRTAITIVGDTLTRDDAVKLAKSKA